MRRGIKLSALVQLAYICVRTLWHSVPFLTGGEAPPLAPPHTALLERSLTDQRASLLQRSR